MPKHILFSLSLSVLLYLDYVRLSETMSDATAVTTKYSLTAED